MAGRELAHVCIIDYHTSDKLFDEIVVPSAPITDYLTRWSGLSPSSFNNVSTTLADVHNYIRTLIKPSTILIGHSLEGDLKAMKVAHARCVDTSIIYHHPRGRPLKPGLKWLMNKWCNKEIQNRGDGGHNPEEDARACVDLLRAKMKNGPSFGHFQVDIENVLERMGRARENSQASSKPIRTAVVDYGTPHTWLGSKATTTVACTSDEDVVKGVEEALGTHDFVFGRMMELSEALGWSLKKPLPSTTLPSMPATVNPGEPPFSLASTPLVEESGVSGSAPSKSLEEVYKSLNDNLTRLYRSFPPSTSFILLSGHGDPQKMAELNKKKYVWETAIKEGQIAFR
jgi:RNA exonuclease 1